MKRLYRVACFLCVLGLSILLVIPLVACQKPTTSGPVTIRFAYPSQLSTDADVNQALAKRYEALAALFHEQNPQLTIKLLPLPANQVKSLGAKDYDVLLFNSIYYAEYAERGLLRSLAPWMSLGDKSWSGDYLPTVLKPFERKGELWAIPWALDPLILYYNKDLLSSYGVSAPQQGWNWSDFLEKAHAVTDSKKDIFGAVMLNMYSIVPAVIYQHGGQIFDDWSQPTRATFDNPRNAEALSWLASLIQEYKVMPTQAKLIGKFGIYQTAWYRGVNTGVLGMWTGGYSERGGGFCGGDAKWDMSWGAAPLAQDAQAATVVSGFLLGISPKAADADACWQWLAYLSQQLPPDLFLPARTSSLQQVKPVDSANQETLNAGADALKGTLLIIVDQREFAKPGMTAFWQAAEAVLQKGEPAEVQLQLAQQKAK